MQEDITWEVQTKIWGYY